MKVILSLLLLLAACLLVAGESPNKSYDWSVDFRGRYELTDFDEDSGKDRQRWRIRFRVSGNWNLNEKWTIGARLATGNADDHRTTNQTLDDGFKRIDFKLDRGFIRFRHKQFSGWFGKFAHPFRAHTAYPEMVWDADIQPEGLAGSWAGDYFHGSAVYYIIDEKGNDSDVGAPAVQIGGAFKGSVATAWDLSYYDYSDLEGEVLLGSTVGKVALLEGQGMIDFPMGRWRGVGSIQYVFNTDAASDEDTGLVASFALKGEGFLRNIFIQAHDLEEESVLAFNAQDDFLFDTNFEGWTSAADLALWKNTQLRLWLLASKSNQPGSSTIIRYRVDLNLRF